MMHQTRPELDERQGSRLTLPPLRAVKGKVTMKRVLTVLLAVALLGTAVYWYDRSAPEMKAPVVFEVKKGDFTTKLTELGELRALKSITISAQVDLPIIELAPEGTYVKKGERLVRFDPGKYETALEESKAALEVTEAELQKARKDLDAQREKLLADIAGFERDVRLGQLDLDDLQKKPLPDERERVRMELEKAKVAFENARTKQSVLPELLEKGFITRASLADAELGLVAAKMTLQVAQFTHDNTLAGATPQELDRAQVRLGQAKVALERARTGMKSQLESFEASVDSRKANMVRSERLIDKAQKKFDITDLRAPKAGLVVYALVGEKKTEKVQLGMVPFLGQALLYLPDLSTIVADTLINEIDIGKVKKDGPVEVRLEAYPGVVFHGTVLQIGSLAKLKQSLSGTASGIKVFDVTVKIEEKDLRLTPGLTATLDIIIDRQEDVMAIPLSAVDSRRGEQIAFVFNAGRIEERKVVLGPSNDQHVIVKEGLRPGEQVLLSPPSSGTL